MTPTHKTHEANRLQEQIRLREHPRRRCVMRQTWTDLLFLHWEVSPERIQADLPPGLRVDTHEGKAWLGVVPFFMNAIRPALLPPVPGLSWFLELNVRTYVVDELGRPGVWFYSLDCNQTLAVEIARKHFHLPYEHATMKAQRIGSSVEYHSKREYSEGGPDRFHYSPAPDTTPSEAEPGSLEFFLLERYLLFSRSPRGLLYSGRVHHSPYTYQPAELTGDGAGVLRHAGFEFSDPPALAHFSPGVDVEVFTLQQVPGSADELTEHQKAPVPA